VTEEQQIQTLIEATRLHIAEAVDWGVPRRTIATLLVGIGAALAIEVDGLDKARADLKAFADRMGAKS
jgi:hypothetical protein